MINSPHADRSSWVDVMVVDARPADYVEMAATLAVERMTFRFARSADDALRMVKGSPQAVWMINGSLPDMPGAELLTLLREREPQIASFFVGDWYRPEDEMQSRECGSSAYVCKPAVADWLAPWRTREQQSVKRDSTTFSTTG